MRGFVEELRYRNVFRVGVAYAVAAWLVAQVADLAADAFSAPGWVMQMLIVVLGLGFPVALFLAWAFELTPDGVKRAKDLPADAPKDPRAGRRLNRITIAALIVAVAWLGWDKVRGPDPDASGGRGIDRFLTRPRPNCIPYGARLQSPQPVGAVASVLNTQPNPVTASTATSSRVS